MEGPGLSIKKLSIRQIKAARALLDWSQDNLAAKSGVSAPTIGRLEAEGGDLGAHQGEHGTRPAARRPEGKDADPVVDFGKAELLRILGQALKKALRDKVTNPEFAFISRAELGLYSLLHQFKYSGQRHLRFPVAGWLRETLHDSRLRDRRFDVIVPVPLHPVRERERGFNQAQLLAELLTVSARAPLRLILERTRYTTTQTAHDRAERMENLHGAFRLRKNQDVRDLRVLLIDDVLTTGSTLSECARVLKNAGAISIQPPSNLALIIFARIM